MKLATKLVAAFMVVTLLVIVTDTWFAARNEVRRYDDAVRSDVRHIGLTLRRLVVETSRAGGNARVVACLEEINATGRGVAARWVSFAAAAAERDRPLIGVELADVRGAPNQILFCDPLGAGEIGLLAYVDVPLAGSPPGGIELVLPAHRMLGILPILASHSWRLAGGLILLSALLSVSVGSWLVARPLQKLTEKAERMGEGDLSGPVEIGGRDELAQLGHSINTMCARLARNRESLREETARRIEAIEQLRHADRLRTVGRFAAGVAHEVGTPLAVVAGRAGMIGGGGLSEEELKGNARIIKEQADRIAGIVRQMLDFARSSTLERAPVDLGGLLEQTVNLVEGIARKHGVRLVLEPPAEPVTVDVDAGQIQQVLTNLIVNAGQAMPEGGPVTIAFRRSRGRAPDMPGDDMRPVVRIDVRDEGTGIDADDLPRVFDPFFTTKDVGEGTGMGLSVAYGIVQEHGGWITVSSTVGAGSCFSLFLPVEASA